MNICDVSLEIVKPLDEKDLQLVKGVLFENDIQYFECDDVLVVEGRHYMLDSIIMLSCYYTLTIN